MGNLAGVDVKSEVFDALENNAYCVTAAVDYLINDAVSLAKASIWAPGGTGSRIFGENIANKAVKSSTSTSSNQKSAQEKIAEMQQKLKGPNLTNKQRKKFKK